MDLLDVGADLIPDNATVSIYRDTKTGAGFSGTLIASGISVYIGRLHMPQMPRVR